LSEILPLVVLAQAVNDNGVQHFSFPVEAVKAWQVPNTGEAVLLPQSPLVRSVFEQLVRPPDLNRGNRPPLAVSIVTSDYILFRQAAENLQWHGIQAVYQYSEAKPPAETEISYYGPTLKGSFHWLVAWLFGRQPAEVSLVRDDDEPVEYRVVLGRAYNPCLPDPMPPADALP
jgi:hypothetical protein